MSNSPPILLLGGRSLLAPYVMQRLAAAGLFADVVTRQSMELPEGFQSHPIDISASSEDLAPTGAIVISLLPLTVLAANLARFTRARSIIALSSTSRFSKSASDDPKERKIAEGLESAEATLTTWCRGRGVSFTILRPTLIYDGVRDNNVSRIARFARRFGFFPVATPASGLRQPIHADDVAKAIMNAIGNPKAANVAVNIAGSEVLTYRAMVERVFVAIGRKPRLLMLPTQFLQVLFQLGSKVGFLRESSFGFGVFKRMNENLVFDNEKGLRILDYAPRGFEPRFTSSPPEGEEAKTCI